MSTRKELLASIAATTADYRAGELPAPTPEHVDRWVRQFPAEAQDALLEEMSHVLSTSYISRETVVAFLNMATSSDRLAGEDPEAFWRGAALLDCQLGGQSQRAMLELFDVALTQRYGFGRSGCTGGSSTFVYLDDVIYSGGRASADLRRWITEDAPDRATLHVVVIAAHAYGQYTLAQDLHRQAREAGKQIAIDILKTRVFENRVNAKDSSEVLWPVALPDDERVREFAAREERFPWQPRNPNGPLGPFSSEAGRQLLETQFLVAGVEILSRYGDLSVTRRPLGFGRFGLGFGTMTVTYRNCPNNAPLALWWSLDGWQPLFRRETYANDAGGLHALLA